MAISLTTAVSLLQRTRRPAARRRADVQLGFDALSDLYYRYWGEYFHLALREPDAAQDADALARDYDRTHERYLAAVRGQGAERILEVSCGGGALSAWLADRTGASVVGVDQSAGQLSRAQQRTAGGQRPSLRFVQGEVDRLAELAELGTDPYDAALCLDAACYYPDRRRAFRQVAAGFGRAAGCSSSTGAPPRTSPRCSASSCWIHWPGCGRYRTGRPRPATGGCSPTPDSCRSTSRT